MTLSPSADVLIINGYDNRGTDPLLGVYQDRDRTLIRFDLSLPPTNAVLRSAELLLWPDTTWFNGGGNGDTRRLNRASQSSHKPH